jgi:hypothetical protein
LLIADSSVNNSTFPYLSQIEVIKDELSTLKEKNDKLEQTVHNYIQAAETVRISDLDIAMLEKDGYVCISKSVDTPQDLHFTVPEKFVWPVPDKELDKKNADAYLEYLQKISSDFKRLHAKKSI